MTTTSISIDLSSLAGGSRRLEFHEQIALGQLGAFRFPNPFNVQVTVERLGEVVDVDGEAEGGATATCDRCLEEYVTVLVIDVNEHLPLEVAGDPLSDSNVIKDGKLDLTDLIRQLVGAELPYVSLCREQCLGLCTDCGMNLNEGTCGCKAATKGDHG